MSKMPANIRFHEDKAKGTLYVRAGKQLLFRVREMKRTSKAPVLQLFSHPDDNTLIVATIRGEQEFIDITHTPPALNIIEEEQVPEEIEPFICPPGFIVYNGIASSAHDGYILGYDQKNERWVNAGWPAGIDDSPVGGWWHLETTVNNLADPSVHNNCDLITWYGNPTSMCADNVWTDTLGGSQKIALKTKFYYRGVSVSTPKYILGACITTANGKDYFNILGTDGLNTSGAQPWRLNGTDETVWRKDITKPNHGTDDWELLNTIDYEELVSPGESIGYKNWPMGTAYVDEEGIAWYGKRVSPTIAYPYWRRQLRIDLKTGDWAPSENNSTSWGIGSASHVINESNTVGFSGSGEEYMSTMGGMEARYDLYIRYNHSHSFSQSTAGDISEFTNTAVMSQATNNLLVIKKNGEDYWVGPLSTVSGFNKTLTYYYKATTPDLTETWGGDFGSIPVSQYWYIFLHPHMLDQITVFYRDTNYRAGDLGGAQPITNIYPRRPYVSKFGFRQGSTTLMSWVTTTGNHVHRDRIFDPKLLFQSSGNQSFNGALTHARSIGENSFNPSSQSSFYMHNIDGPNPLRPFMPVEWLCGGCGPAGRVSNGWASGVSDVFNNPITGYRQAFESGTTDTGDGATHPQYSAYHRPNIEGKVPYIVSFSEIMDLNRAQDRVENHADFSVEDGYMNSGLVTYAIAYEDLDLEVGAYSALCWIQSNSYRLLKNNIQFYATEAALLEGGFGEDREYLYTCLTDHISTASNMPPDGAFWEIYWEPRDHKVYTVSNVLTQAQIEELTGEDHNAIINLGVI